MPTAPPTRRSAPRERLLRTATQVFYAKGIHSVGVEEIVETAQITRSTLYRHFPSKEDLVVGYLRAASQMERDALAAQLTPDLSPEAAVRALAEAITSQISSPAFRGCAFINAAAEYPELDHPVHQAVLEHREWFAGVVRGVFARLDEDRADERAALFVMMRDGAMSGGCLGDAAQVGRTFVRGVEALVSPAR